MSVDRIKIKGARVNNLKNIDWELPLEKITCLYGPSGSGKTSLAFHCLYQESKRRFLNSFPNYLKFFSQRPQKADVEEINPVLPVFAMPQVNPIMGSRSTAIDVSGLLEKLQMLFGARGRSICPYHRIGLERRTLAAKVLELLPHGSQRVHLFVRPESYLCLYPQSFPVRSYSAIEKIRPFTKEDDYWEVLRLKAEKLAQSSLLGELEEKLVANNVVDVFFSVDGEQPVSVVGSSTPACPECGFSSEMSCEHRLFSPYNSLGACGKCNGFGSILIYDLKKIFIKHKTVRDGGVALIEFKPLRGQKKYLIEEMKKHGFDCDASIEQLGSEFIEFCSKKQGRFIGLEGCYRYLERKKYKRSVRIYTRKVQKEIVCSECHGTRLSNAGSSFALEFAKRYLTYYDLKDYSFKGLLKIIKSYQNDPTLSAYEKTITQDMFLLLEKAVDLGIGHIQLFRKTKTLSAGEYQRLLILKFFSFKGTGALYVFDEPSLGLSLEEQKKILKFMRELCVQGNTVLMVEHSRYMIQNSDHVCQMGPQSGKLGGEILFTGPPKDLVKINVPKIKKEIKNRKYLRIFDVKVRESTFDKCAIALGEINWVTGPSGCGKTSLFLHGICNILSMKLNGASITDVESSCARLIIEDNDLVRDVNFIESYYAKSRSRSTFGNMTELSGVVRKYLASLPQSMSMGLKDGHFSVHSKLGVCPYCEGKGVKVYEMHFLEDVEVQCEHCDGKKLKPEIASISDGVFCAYEFFEKPLNEIVGRLKLTPKYQRIYEYIQALNLHYLSLERSLASMSGGEIQRLGILAALLKPRKPTVHYLENVSFGLSEQDLVKVFDVLEQFVAMGNTVILCDNDLNCGYWATYRVHFKKNQRLSFLSK